MNVANASAIINIDMSNFGHLARAQVCACRYARNALTFIAKTREDVRRIEGVAGEGI